MKLETLRKHMAASFTRILDSRYNTMVEGTSRRNISQPLAVKTRFCGDEWCQRLAP